MSDAILAETVTISGAGGDDIEGAAADLRRLRSSNGRVGVIGYRSGGRQAFLAAATLRFDAAFEEAGHGFFATDRPSYSPVAAVEGWRQIGRFFEDHLATT